MKSRCTLSAVAIYVNDDDVLYDLTFYIVPHCFFACHTYVAVCNNFCLFLVCDAATCNEITKVSNLLREQTTHVILKHSTEFSVEVKCWKDDLKITVIYVM